MTADAIDSAEHASADRGDPGGIVVGVDGSAGATTALRWAVHEGRLRARAVTAVLAWDYLDQHHADPDAAFDPRYRQPDAEEALDAILDGALGPDGASTVARRVEFGPAAVVLLEVSDPEDL